MRAVYGQFTVEGSGAMPWSEDDERRLRGGYPHPNAPPHVMTPRGPFVIGRVRLRKPNLSEAAKRCEAIAEWAAEQGDLDAEAFYRQRATTLRSGA